VPVESWLTDTLEIQRHLVNAYFIVMAFIALAAILLAWRTRFKWLSLYLWLIAGIIGLVWEAILFGVGSRQYTLFAVGELLYHALTEGGPGLIITVLFANWVGIIDMERYRDPGPTATDEEPTDGAGVGPEETAPREGTGEGTGDGGVA
jgi:hypothetical protein